MSKQTCPPDHDWMPLLVGEAVAVDVQTHVDACTTCRSRLDEAQAELAELRSFSRLGETTSYPAAVAPAPRPATIGKYLVVGALDAGGQARVFRALHPVLDKEVVIKLGLHPVDPESGDRHLLVTEGKLLASLEHPNMARIFDLDFHEDRPYLVMEYVRGRHLGRWAGEEKPAPRESARIVAAIARALAAVHRHGVIHQDVKPQNILLDEAGRPRLIDFGLARLGHAWADGPVQPGGGTPAFMAPEQARAEDAQISPRSDVFALGGVLYFLLTGKTPFTGDTLQETVDKAGRCDFDRNALANVPPRLAAICLRALAANPADRYATADALAHDLERWVQLPRTLGRVAGLAAGLLVAVLGVWGAVAWFKPAVKPTGELAVQIVRFNEPIDLEDALPVSTTWDRVRVRGTVPAESQPLLFMLSQDGSVARLQVDVSPGDDRETVIFPPPDKRTELTGSGTEVVLLLAGPRDRRAVEEVEAILRETGPWPAVPPSVFVRMDRDQAEAMKKGGGKPFGATEADPASEVERRLDQLRLRLRERFDVVLAVAFSHYPE